MATKVVDAAGEPIPTSSVLMSAAKHIEIKCMSENVEFLKCKKKDPNPEKCLDKGRQATRCALGVMPICHFLLLWIYAFCSLKGPFAVLILCHSLDTSYIFVPWE
ncbi:hypothetical protein V6N13_104382 [Hibiscus sabdariffa]